MVDESAGGKSVASPATAANAAAGPPITAFQRIPARMVLLVGSLSIFGPLCIDTYLPAFPAIGRELHAGASAVEASLTACLFGLGAGQLLVGPISDRIGRRRPLWVGLVLFIAASVGCALAPNVIVLIALRFLQGLGAAAGLVTSRAVVRDQYSGMTAARFFSVLLLVTGLGPILAPQLGAGLLHFGSWRIIFFAFVVLGGLLLAVSVFALPETLPPAARHGGGLGSTLRIMGEVATNRVFLVNALAAGIGFGALFAYIAGSSFVLENVYGLSPQQFSLAFALNAIGLVAASQVNGRLLSRVSSFKLMTIGLFGLAFGGVALLVVVLTGWFGLPGVLICMFIVLSSNGFVSPNAQALALNDFPHAAGSASALLGVLQFSVGAAIAPLTGLGGSHDALPMAIAMATLGTLAVVTRLALARPPRPVSARAAARAVAQEVIDPP
jgi:MFS transporter, DHA1 family, multidrug resistance protein